MRSSNHYFLGKIRMSPLMYGSLRYIAGRHRNGALNINEVAELKQTQLRSFKKHEWIIETADHHGITITEEGKKALRAFEDNDEFFRRVQTLSFSSLLNLTLPDDVGRMLPERIHALHGKHNSAAA